MKKPAIIDPTIEVRIYSHAMMIPPHKVEEFNQEKETEVLSHCGSVLRGTERPFERHLWQLHCETLPEIPLTPRGQGFFACSFPPLAHMPENG